MNTATDTIKAGGRKVLFPKISIVTPSYNQGEFLEETISSVINQGYPNLEYIIIDGGSTDATLDIIRKYENNISYWISEPDEGIYDAMNKGISLCNGSIVALLNADDYYQNNLIINLVVKSLCLDKNTIYYGDAIIQYDDIHMQLLKKGILDLTKGMTLIHQSMFVCKEIYENNGLYNTKYRYAADLDFTLRTYLANIKYVYIPHTLVNFRYGASSDKHFFKSYLEAFFIIKNNRGIIYSMRYGLIFLKSIFLRSTHRIIRKIFGEAAYFWSKRLYISLLAHSYKK